MPQLILIFFVFLFSPVLVFAKKKHFFDQSKLKQEVYIERFFQAYEGLYKIIALIDIAHNSQYLTIKINKNSFDNQDLKNINFVIANYEKSLWGLKQQEKKPFVISPIKSSNNLMNKEYFNFTFLQKDVFANANNDSQFFLEFTFANNTKKLIAITKDLYLENSSEIKKGFLSSLFKKKNIDPWLSPKRILIY
jgi:hypothetical protein